MKNDNQDNSTNSSDALNSFIEKYGNEKDDPGKSRIISLWEREQKIKTEQTEVLRKELEYLKLEVTKIKLEKNRIVTTDKTNNDRHVHSNNKSLKIIAILALIFSLVAIILVIIFVCLFVIVF